MHNLTEDRFNTLIGVFKTKHHTFSDNQFYKIKQLIDHVAEVDCICWNVIINGTKDKEFIDFYVRVNNDDLFWCSIHFKRNQIVITTSAGTHRYYYIIGVEQLKEKLSKHMLRISFELL